MLHGRSDAGGAAWRIGRCSARRCYLRPASAGKYPRNSILATGYRGIGRSRYHGIPLLCPEPLLSDQPPRPATNENNLLISAYSAHPESPLLAISRRISDSGCNPIGRTSWRERGGQAG